MESSPILFKRWNLNGKFTRSFLKMEFNRKVDQFFFKRWNLNGKFTIFLNMKFNFWKLTIRPTAMLEICDRYILADSEFFFDRWVSRRSCFIFVSIFVSIFDSTFVSTFDRWVSLRSFQSYLFHNFEDTNLQKTLSPVILNH